MAELFSYLSVALYISMVIKGRSAVVALFSGIRPRASSREMKIAWAIVAATVLRLLIIIAIVLVL